MNLDNSTLSLEEFILQENIEEKFKDFYEEYKQFQYLLYFESVNRKANNIKKNRSTKMNDNKIALAKSMYSNPDYTLRDICKTLQISESTLNKYAKCPKTPKREDRRHRINKSKIAQAKELYKDRSRSVASMAKSLNISLITFYRWLKL